MIRIMQALSVLTLLLLSIANPVTSEIYTALVDMEGLLGTETELIRFLDEHIQREEIRLQKLRQYLNEYEKQHEEARTDIQKYLQNPINAYLLVKRLTSDWKNVERLMEANIDHLKNFTEKKEMFVFPDDEDLSGAAVALMRLQDTYKLETSALARGEIQGTVLSNELSAGDCFELGRQAYTSGDHYHTVLWMQEALERAENELNKTVTKDDILEYLAYSTFMQGNVRHALKLTNDLLELVPSHPRAAGNKIYYEDALHKEEQQKRGDDGDVVIDNSYINNSDEGIETSERVLYERLCRGEKTMSLIKQSQLVCRYSANHPYYRFIPFKVEEVSLYPRIVVYYDFMKDSEISVIKQLASPRLRRATVQNYKSGELEFANYRISKSAWLRGEEHPVVETVNQRIEDETGLTVQTAEELQVVNYGIGGHYEPHFDFARKEETNAFKSLGTGNRIATVLFYMSDVDAGGATVFPNIGVALWPKKGSAAFWHNLHRSGDGDLLTRHAACPVLAGSKWVSNKWIHERGQEFRRPCGLRLTDV
uniref:procollagen-proline 4-dioxygenase n=1 Tax=Hemiscolopendra marginata TaxID=943146 RepID=A0A646QE87_9MYRI